MSTFPLDHLSLELLAPTSGFVIGQSRVGDALSLSTDVLTWVPYLADAHGIEIVRGGSRDGAHNALDAGVLTVELVNAGDPLADLRVKPNAPVRVVQTADGAAVFTGKVQDVATTYDRDGNVRVLFSAVDAVAAHANTTRYGAVVPAGALFEPWHKRIARLCTSATAPTALPPAPAPLAVYVTPFTQGRVDDWAYFGSVPLGASPQYRQLSAGGLLHRLSRVGTVTYDGPTFGWQRTVTGLIPGRYYTITMRAALGTTVVAAKDYAVGVEGVGWSDPVTLDLGPARPVTFTFLATSSSHTVRWAPAGVVATFSGSWVEYILVQSVTVALLPIADPYMLRDVAFESDLQSHFDLACDSVGAYWWVDVDNVTRFERALAKSPIVAVLADVDQPDEPLYVPYTDVKMSYDTRNVINDLTLNQHARDASTGEAVDTSVGFSNPTSVVSWGPRASSLDTSLWTGSGYESSLTTRANQVLGTYGTPEVVVSSVTFNAMDGLDVVAGLDVYSRVVVIRNGQAWTLRVTGIAHDIQPDRWLITLTTTKDV